MAGAMLGVTYAAPSLSFPVPVRTVVALAFAALGLGSAIAGVIAFRRQHTTVNPLTPGASSAIVTGGIYRVSRNPMYLSFLLVIAGWVFCLSIDLAALFLHELFAYIYNYLLYLVTLGLLELFLSSHII